MCVALVKDKLLPDKSFKVPAAGVLGKLGEKAAGDVVKELTGEIVGRLTKPLTEKTVSFFSGLLSGNAKAAPEGITKEDSMDLA